MSEQEPSVVMCKPHQAEAAREILASTKAGAIRGFAPLVDSGGKTEAKAGPSPIEPYGLESYQ